MPVSCHTYFRTYEPFDPPVASFLSSTLQGNDGSTVNQTQSVPFTLEGNVTISSGSMGYIFCLNQYANGQSSGIFQTGIAILNNDLVLITRHDFNPTRYTVYTTFASYEYGTPFHLAVEATDDYIANVAVNGQFVLSQQLSATTNVPYNGIVPQLGGCSGVGLGTANQIFFDIQGSVTHLKLWNSLKYHNVDFTP